MSTLANGNSFLVTQGSSGTWDWPIDLDKDDKYNDDNIVVGHVNATKPAPSTKKETPEAHSCSSTTNDYNLKRTNDSSVHPAQKQTAKRVKTEHGSLEVAIPSRKAAGPFYDEDSSGDEVSSLKHEQKQQIAIVRGEEDRARKAAQREASERLRHEALSKKQSDNWSDSGSMVQAVTVRPQYETRRKEQEAKKQAEEGRQATWAGQANGVWEGLDRKRPETDQVEVETQQEVQRESPGKAQTPIGDKIEGQHKSRGAVELPVVEKPTSTTDTTFSEAKSQRQRLVQAKTERNDRNREADARDNEYNVVEEEDLFKAPEAGRKQQMPETFGRRAGTEDLPRAIEEKSSALKSNGAAPVRPCSLNSLAGQAAIARINRLPSEQASHTSPTWQLHFNLRSRGHRRRLGEILPEDIKLVQMRDAGMKRSDVVQLYEESTGLKRAEKTLSDRYSQVKAALTTISANEDLLERVASGDITAVRELNDAVRLNQHASASLGEITAEDIKVLLWRASGMKYEDIAVTLETSTGVTQQYSTLWQRHEALKALVDWQSISGTLLDRAATGDQEALQQINIQIRGSWTVAPKPGHGRPPIQSKTPVMKGPRLTTNTGMCSINTSVTTQSHTPCTHPEHSSPTLPTSPVLHNASAGARPTIGGKTLNESAYRYYLESIQEAYAEESEKKTRVESDAESFTEEDYCHFYYQAQRREVNGPELDEGIELDSKTWQDCGKQYSEHSRANATAAREVMNAFDDDLASAIVNTKWDLSRDLGEDGQLTFTLKCGSEGLVQTRVERRFRAAHDRIRPRSTKGWLSRTVFYVKERQSTRTSKKMEPEGPLDGLFDEVEEIGEETPQYERHLKNEAHTTLEGANEVAVEHVLLLGFHSNSINMDRREVERQQAKNELQRELTEQGEGALFCKTVESEQSDDGTVKIVKVFVEQGRLVGPRNLW